MSSNYSSDTALSGSNKGRLKAFTLIELLVVIAIIAILARRCCCRRCPSAKRKAQGVACENLISNRWPWRALCIKVTFGPMNFGQTLSWIQALTAYQGKCESNSLLPHRWHQQCSSQPASHCGTGERDGFLCLGKRILPTVAAICLMAGCIRMIQLAW